MTDREPSEVMVKVLDKEQFLKDCSVQLNKVITTFEEFGVVETSEGSFFFSNEGVGSTEPVSEINPGQLPLYESIDNAIGMFPIKFVQITNDHTLAWKEKRVPLHKFIRTFGNRLESNYRQWKRFLESKQKL